MALQISQQHQSPRSEDLHDNVPEREEEVQSRFRYDVPRTYSSPHDQRRSPLAQTPDSHDSTETKSFIETSDAPQTQGGTDSTLMDPIPAPRKVPKGHSLRESPPLWKIWWLETACMTLSFIFFSVIITVLYKHDQASIPRWRLQITLNSVVAFFTTLVKACFMIPVSVAISQTQWSWFLEDKPLYDLHVLDQASRGPWGSVILLTRVKWRHFVAMGALLTITSALTSPITQLVISYPARDVLTQEPATVAAVRVITNPGNNIARRARTALMLGTIPNSKPASLVSCPTGNCTFNQFESLGMCMQIKNVTSQLRIEKFENPAPTSMVLTGANDGSRIVPEETIWRASMPGDKVELIHQTGIAAFSEMLNGNDTSAFRADSKMMQTRVASVILIYTTPIINTNNTWQDGKDSELKKNQTLTSVPRHEAIEIIFHMCVQSFETTVYMGEEKTDRINSLAEPLEQDPPFELKVNCSSGFNGLIRHCEDQKAHWNDTLFLKGSLNIQSNISSPNFTVDYHSMEKIAQAIKMYLVGYARAVPESNVRFSGTIFSNFFSGVLFVEQHLKNSTLRNEKIKEYFEAVAVHFSASLREVKDNEPQTSFNISGMAWREESYVQVRWGWITFLAAELLAATIFLCITIIAQLRDRGDFRSVFHNLKDSALAPLLALSDECRVAAGGGLQPVDELKGKAMQLKVRFDGNEIIPVQTIGTKKH